MNRLPEPSLKVFVLAAGLCFVTGMFTFMVVSLAFRVIGASLGTAAIIATVFTLPVIAMSWWLAFVSATIFRMRAISKELYLGLRQLDLLPSGMEPIFIDFLEADAEGQNAILASVSELVEAERHADEERSVAVQAFFLSQNVNANLNNDDHEWIIPVAERFAEVAPFRSRYAGGSRNPEASLSR